MGAECGSFTAFHRGCLFSAPFFARSMSVVTACYTGQAPGNAISIPAAPDVHTQLGSKFQLHERAGTQLVGEEWGMLVGAVPPSVAVVPGQLGSSPAD